MLLAEHRTFNDTVMTADDASIGERIAILRKAKNLTQEELSEATGFHSQSISEWERGRRLPRVDTLGKLAEALGVTLEELVYGKKPLPKRQLLDDAAKDQIVAYLRLATRLLEEAPPRIRDRVSGPLEGIEGIVSDDPST